MVRSGCVRSVVVALVILHPSQLFAQSDRVFSTGRLPPDPKVYNALPTSPQTRGFLPVRAMLNKKYLPGIGDQGKAGSCVAWSIGYTARLYLGRRFQGWSRKMKDHLSPTAFYSQVKGEPKSSCDVGANMGVAMLALDGFGTEPWTREVEGQNACFVPWRTHLWQKRFGQFSFTTLSKSCETFPCDEKKVTDDYLDTIKKAIVDESIVVMGFSTTGKFMKPRLWQNGIYDDASDYVGPNGKHGGHAMVVDGYDDEKQAFHIRNSWGTSEWTKDGMAWFSYDQFQKDADEVYEMYLVDHKPKPQPDPKPPKPDSQPEPDPQPEPEPQPEPVPQPDPDPQPDPRPDERTDLDSIIRKFDNDHCSSMKVVSAGNEKSISGFVESDDELIEITKLVAEFNPKLSIDVRPWPQCEVLKTLKDPIAASQGPAVLDIAPNATFQAGDQFKFTVKAPEEASYIYVTQIQASGRAFNLTRLKQVSNSRALPNETVKFGYGGDTGDFKVGPPYGRELLVVISSNSPLHKGDRPLEESDRTFLSSLRAGLAKQKTTQSIKAVIVPIRTEASR